MIKVIDSVMGTGKSTLVINKAKMSKTPYLVVVPLLSEVKRFEDVLDTRKLDNTRSTNLLEQLEEAVVDGASVILTHKLFELFTDDTYSLLESVEEPYSLFLDETVSLVNEVNIDEKDLKICLNERLIELKPSKKEGLTHVYLTERGEDYLSGKNKLNHTILLERAATGRLFHVKGNGEKEKSLLAFICLPEHLTKFKDAYLLTYLFKGSETDRWLRVWGLPYLHCTLDRTGNVIPHSGVYSKDGQQFKEKIIICEDRKLNAVGRKLSVMSKNPFSTGWYKDRGNRARLKQVRNNVINFVRYKTLADKRSLIWTCPKAYRDKVSDRYFHTKNKEGIEGSFLPQGTRATNDWRDRDVAIVLAAFFPHGSVNAFFRAYSGIVIDSDIHRLGQLLQWLFRSTIRDGNCIVLYLPNEELRNLLKNWLGYEAGEIDRKWERYCAKLKQSQKK